MMHVTASAAVPSDIQPNARLKILRARQKNWQAFQRVQQDIKRNENFQISMAVHLDPPSNACDPASYPLLLQRR